MEAAESGTGVGLIPGLPEELVLAHVVPRVPWYSRPVCRAISKHWRASLDTCKSRAELAVKTRKYQLPLLKGLFLICTFEDTQIFIARDHMDNAEGRAMYTTARLGSYTYQIHRQWRKLPPMQGLVPLPLHRRAMLLASSGIVYVWSDEPNVGLKMDLGCGDWTWSKLPIPHCFNVNAIDFNGKIYVPQVSAGGSPSRQREVVLMYNTRTDQCEQVETWCRDNLRVLLKTTSSHSVSHVEEELYGLVEHESKLEVLVYDACRDSWTTQEEIPFPEWKWSELSEVKLLNGDCFEPASEISTNIVWIDSENEVISWFNSKTWVSIYCDAFLEGKYMDNMQFIRGSLYAVFCEDKRDQDGEEEENKDSQEEEEDSGSQQYTRMCKRIIMKGRICVAKGSVVWEEMHEIGCFEESSIVYPYAVDLYTMMA